MAKPVASPAQIAAINQTIASQQNQQTALALTASLQDSEIAKANVVDSSFQSLFAWYNDSIIGKYDSEKKALNGVFVTTPVSESDIVNVAANPPSGRLVPTPPVYDIQRIPEFDGGNTSISPLSEAQHIADQTSYEGWLVSGFSPQPTINTTSQTASSLTSGSTTLNVTDTASFSFAVGSYFAVKSGSDSAIVKVLTVTSTGTLPLYAYTLSIQVIVAPTGTLASGSDLIVFSGFSNSERAAKTASQAYFQSLMNNLVTSLSTVLGSRISRITEQNTARTSNEDPDGTANFTLATTQANASSTFLTTYLLTTDISNTGLATLASERATRSPQIASRVAQINAAYTGQTENYYNQRYSAANNRGNTQRGTLRTKSNAQGVKDSMTGMAASIGSSISALTSILP